MANDLDPRVGTQLRAETELRVKAIEAWRLDRGLSVSELADLVTKKRGKVNCRRRVTAILNGETELSDQYLTSLMSALEISDLNQLLRGPKADSSPYWLLNQINCNGESVSFMTRTAKIDCGEELLVGASFPQFLRQICVCGQTGSSPLSQSMRLCGISDEQLESFGEYMKVGDILTIVGATNMPPSQLPILGDACNRIQEILNQIEWQPSPSGNLLSWLACRFDRMKQSDAFAYQNAREKYGMDSANYLSTIGKTARQEILDKATEYNRMMLEHLANHLLEAAILSHVGFHESLMPKRVEMEVEAFGPVLKASLRSSTERAMNDPSMLTVFKKQHGELLRLLKQPKLTYDEVYRWYQREHAFSIIPTIEELSRVG